MNTAAREEEDGTIDDEAVAHAVRLLRRTDDSAFARWVDICDDVFVRDGHGNTLLHWAAALGQLRPVKLLVGCGLDLECRNAGGATPVLCAAASCRNPGSVLSYFLRHGARMDIKNSDGDDAFTLLEKRDLGKLVDIFEMLKESMEGCPRLFSSRGCDAGDLPDFSSSSAILGTATGLSKPVSTVRFRHDDASRDNIAQAGAAPQSDDAAAAPDDHLDCTSMSAWGLTLARKETPSPTVEGRPDATDMRGDLLANLVQDEAAARNVLLVMQAEELMSIMAGLLQLTTWLYNNLTLEVYTTDEEEDFMDASDGEETEDGTRNSTSDAAASQDRIAAVLGERHDMDGERILLVQWLRGSMSAPSAQQHGSSPNASAATDGVEWVPLRDVADSPCVRRYVSRFDKTYSDTALNDNSDSSFGLNHTNHNGGALDDEERDELERILGMIPPRIPSPEPPGTSRASNHVSFHSSRSQSHWVEATANFSRNNSARLGDGQPFAVDRMDMFGHTNSDELPAMLRTVVREPDSSTASSWEESDGSDGLAHSSPSSQLQARPAAVEGMRGAGAFGSQEAQRGDVRLLDGCSSDTNGSQEAPSTAAPSPAPAALPSPIAKAFPAAKAAPTEPTGVRVDGPSSSDGSGGRQLPVADAGTAAAALSVPAPLGQAAAARDGAAEPSRRFVPPSAQQAVNTCVTASAFQAAHEGYSGMAHAVKSADTVAFEAATPLSEPASAAAEARTPSPQSEAPPRTRYQLSGAEQLDYQRFLYQSAIARLRARNGGFAAVRQK